jgi:CheY-like chemotaxis protein
VEDLRDIARINEGSVELQMDDFSPRDVINDVLGMLHPKFVEKAHNLRVNLDDAPASIQGDKSRIRQVIKNLLSNACKYTPHGGKVSIATAIVNDELRIEVTDTGIGIPEEDRHKIFKEFSRASNADSEATGQGLGLALSRRIIEMHWGQIDFSSKVGQGTTFWIQLPIRAGRRQNATIEFAGPVTERSRFRGFKIILADTNEPRAQELIETLREDDHTVILVANGNDLVESVAANGPDLVLTVLKLPGLNAYEAVQQIRCSPKNETLPIILLSKAEIPNVEAHGFSGWLRLPIEADRLRKVLADIGFGASTVAN